MKLWIAVAGFVLAAPLYAAGSTEPVDLPSAEQAACR
jgi:hypothetical protein